MNPTIEDWKKRTQEAAARAEALLTDTPTERLNAAPPPGEEWSAAQHLEHLTIVTDKIAGKIEEALLKNAPTGNPGEWQPNWMERPFIAACGPQPSGRTMPAPKLFIPAAGPYDPTELRQRFTEAHDRFVRLLDRAENVDVRRVKVASAAMPLLRLRLGAWFEANTVHIAYHTDRAEALAR